MDLYRMRSSQEAIMAGVEDCILHALAQSDFVFAEWPERAPGLFPDAAVVVCIESYDDSQRTLTLTVPHP
jgi:tRNA A37 threonylcarbamoyladenosine biosynthesis protein TsaE